MAGENCTMYLKWFSGTCIHVQPKLPLQALLSLYREKAHFNISLHLLLLYFFNVSSNADIQTDTE